MKWNKYISSFLTIFAICSYLIMAGTFLKLWISPGPQDAEQVLTYSVLMGVEFIMVHSGMFMMVFSGYKLSFVFFAVFYGLFIYSFMEFLPNNIILYSYLAVLFNRMKFIFLPAPGKIRLNAVHYSIITACGYFLLLASFTALNNTIPNLGLTAAYLKSSSYHTITTSGGLLMDKPHVGLAFGITYFIFLALLESYFSFWKKARA